MTSHFRNYVGQAFLPVLVAALLFTSLGCNKLRARDQLNKGVRAYKSAQFSAAIEHFKTAIELDPQLPVARLYLATAYANQFVPGAESADNMKMGQQAVDEFKKVLQEDPNNVNATAGVASIYFNMKKLDDARVWYQKQIALQPNNPEAYYSIGVIGWSQTYPKRMELKSDLHLQPQDPIKDKKARDKLCEGNLPIIEEAFKNLNKSIELRPDYDDAMAYLNLMYRERADCEEGQARDDDLKKADEWVNKTLEIKKKKANAPTPGITQQ